MGDAVLRMGEIGFGEGVSIGRGKALHFARANPAAVDGAEFGRFAREET